MSESNEVPLSANAQEAKEMMHQQLMRKMANKMMAAAIEEERQRRIQSEKEEEEDTVRRKAFDQLVVVQEDLVRCLNLMKVSLTRGESLGGAVQLGLQLLASDTNLPCLGLNPLPPGSSQMRPLNSFSVKPGSGQIRPRVGHPP